MRLPRLLLLALGTVVHVSPVEAGELFHKVRPFDPQESTKLMESKGDNFSETQDGTGLDQCSKPKRDSCAFYKSCLEAAVPCGPEGYAIAYGDHYCLKFEPVLGHFSDRGKAWVSNARYCLQEKLVPYATSQKRASCEALQEYAFATHPPCYIDNGLCTLPPSDWLVILHTVGVEGLFGNIDAFIATLEAAGGCIDFYIWLIRGQFIDKTDSWSSKVELSRLFSSAPHRHNAELTPTPITYLSETETMMAESVAKFAQEEVGPKVREMDEAEAMDPAVVEQLFEQGLMGIEIPEEYGGAGMNFTSAIIGIEELARIDPSVSVMVDVHNTLVNTAVLKYGSAAVKKKWLPRLATDTVGSFCLSEPISGSDAFALQTKAEKTSSGYKLNGSKMWITNSMEAGFFIVFANLDPSKGYKGITAFIVEKDMPGFNIAKKEKKLGIRASSTCVLNFDDVEVPKENVLGEEGQGYKYAISLLNEGRIGIAAQMTGLALGAWENAAGYIWNDRKQFGQLIGTFQGMQHQVAQSYTEIAAARALVFNAARKKEAGQDFVQDAAMAKLYASQVAGRVSGLAVEWMGGMGFVREGIAEKMFRDSKIGAIYEGTSNIQLQTIAKTLQKTYTK
ncbi:hypothetical protein MferCBS49748_007028 [Microsporum ferrugineum]